MRSRRKYFRRPHKGAATTTKNLIAQLAVPREEEERKGKKTMPRSKEVTGQTKMCDGLLVGSCVGISMGYLVSTGSNQKTKIKIAFIVSSRLYLY